MDIKIMGSVVDKESRCIHYHAPVDIIAIKFKCCHDYYPCYQCHKEATDHAVEVWSKTEYDEKAVLCGVCKTELTIHQYMNSDNICPNCRSQFNPNCDKHYHLYFAI
ncbi:MAG TPA: hypothetical protein DIS90_04115 [Cytophagales bacterium]|nr:hypothetical protein [Cytophagales bacterium]